MLTFRETADLHGVDIAITAMLAQDASLRFVQEMTLQECCSAYRNCLFGDRNILLEPLVNRADQLICEGEEIPSKIDSLMETDLRKRDLHRRITQMNSPVDLTLYFVMKETLGTALNDDLVHALVARCCAENHVPGLIAALTQPIAEKRKKSFEKRFYDYPQAVAQMVHDKLLEHLNDPACDEPWETHVAFLLSANQRGTKPRPGIGEKPKDESIQLAPVRTYHRSWMITLKNLNGLDLDTLTKLNQCPPYRSSRYLLRSEMLRRGAGALGLYKAQRYDAWMYLKRTQRTGVIQHRVDWHERRVTAMFPFVLELAGRSYGSLMAVCDETIGSRFLMLPGTEERHAQIRQLLAKSPIPTTVAELIWLYGYLKQVPEKREEVEKALLDPNMSDADLAELCSKSPRHSSLRQRLFSIMKERSREPEKLAFFLKKFRSGPSYDFELGLECIKAQPTFAEAKAVFERFRSKIYTVAGLGGWKDEQDEEIARRRKVMTRFFSLATTVQEYEWVRKECELWNKEIAEDAKTCILELVLAQGATPQPASPPS